MADTPLRVLIVDDSRDDAELAELALGDGGLQVDCRRAHREPELRELLVAFAPDLVLCDVNLPGYSCVQAHAAARELVPRARFVFLSGALDERMQLPGADGVVLKDDLARLPALVQGLFASGRRAPA